MTLLRESQLNGTSGELQINTWVWGTLAAKMDDDLNTEAGNIAFGKYLFNTYGSSPWNPSKKCWE